MPSDPGEVQRLHPVSLLFSLGSAARGLLLPGIAVLYFSGGSNLQLWMMIFFVPAAITAGVRYWGYRYRMGEDELIVREGIISRNERHIPYARIQNIDLVQNPLHRLLGVAEARLETASGGSPEAVMRVLSLQAVTTLRRRIFESRGAEPATSTESADAESGRETLLHLRPSELALYGLISNRGLAVIAAAMGLFWQFDVFDRYLDDLERRLDEMAPKFVENMESLSLPGPVATVAAVLFAIGAVLVLLRLMSALWTIVKFHDFKLTRLDDDIRAEYGLLTRVALTIPRHRIQLLSVRAGALHRLFGRATIQVETAGGTESQEGSSVNRLLLAPLLRRERVQELIAHILPEARPGDVSWTGVAPSTRRRLFRVSLVVLIPIAVGAFLSLGPWGLTLLAPAVALVWINARLYVRHAGYALTPTALFYRSGWWIRRTSLVLFNKMQTVNLTQSPFDRRHATATLNVDTAGAGRVGHSMGLRYLDAAAARGMHERLADEAGRTAFRW
ncbi:MAG: PH domain-containing protein [bacterium]|nr:PH domain-containing protein [bacterium]